MVSSDLTINYRVKITTITGLISNPVGSAVPNGRAFLYPKAGPGLPIVADDNGLFSFDAAEGSVVTLVCPEMMYDKKFTVPESSLGNDPIDIRQIETTLRYDFPSNRFYI